MIKNILKRIKDFGDLKSAQKQLEKDRRRLEVEEKKLLDGKQSFESYKNLLQCNLKKRGEELQKRVNALKDLENDVDYMTRFQIAYEVLKNKDDCVAIPFLKEEEAEATYQIKKLDRLITKTDFYKSIMEK
jgi:hypothetical protein